MKIILPGGAGLVGQNLVARLKEKGYSNIIVLDKGAIIEQGTHQSLLLEKGKYFEMWGKQKPS